MGSQAGGLGSCDGAVPLSAQRAGLFAQFVAACREPFLVPLSQQLGATLLLLPSVHHEYCETPEDFVARRTRLAFLDKLACEQALPKVVELMAGEKGWSRRRAARELQRALDFLKTFDAPLNGPPPL